MDQRELGRQLRTLRTAEGRTVASVAVDAGLSVPYVANLENGRGNPTTSALSRLAAALGTEMAISFNPVAAPAAETAPPLPASLVRLSRTRRFRRDVQVLAEAVGAQSGEFSAQLVRTLAHVAQLIGRDPDEPDWWRLLDALLLITTYPREQHPVQESAQSTRCRS